MPKTWVEIEATDTYKNASPEDQDRVKNRWMETVLSPNTPPGRQGEAAQRFLAKYPMNAAKKLAEENKPVDWAKQAKPEPLPETFLGRAEKAYTENIKYPAEYLSNKLAGGIASVPAAAIDVADWAVEGLGQLAGVPGADRNRPSRRRYHR